MLPWSEIGSSLPSRALEVALVPARELKLALEWWIDWRIELNIDGSLSADSADWCFAARSIQPSQCPHCSFGGGVLNGGFVAENRTCGHSPTSRPPELKDPQKNALPRPSDRSQRERLPRPSRHPHSSSLPPARDDPRKKASSLETHGDGASLGWRSSLGSDWDVARQSCAVDCFRPD